MTAEIPTARSRRLPLKGAVNCRDFGGYKTADGRTTRWNLLYRSDSLADLTDDDIKLLSGLELRTIFDFRHEVERTAKPNRPLTTAGVVTLTPGFLPHNAHEMVIEARKPGASAEALRGQIRQTYRRFVTDHTPVYKYLFELLVQPDRLPMMIHCTSGKDRTGFAAALILSALGVPAETVVEDYMLSNEYRRDLRYLAGAGTPFEILSVMMEAHPAALEASFEDITKTWSSIDGYLENGLGVTPEIRAKLQAQFLDPAL